MLQRRTTENLTDINKQYEKQMNILNIEIKKIR